MYVKEIMTSTVEAVAPDATLLEVSRKMRDMNLGSLLVEEGGKIIGIVTDRDLACRAMAHAMDPATTPAREIMSKDVVYCFDDEDVADVAHLMEERKLYRLPVLSHQQKMVGVLSISDLAQHASHELSGEVLQAVSRHVH
ncbi:MAG: CBS domain-containing protein [Sphingomonadales bacterium]